MRSVPFVALVICVSSPLYCLCEEITFRNIATTSIQFSLRADDASAPETQVLGVGESITFDLTSNGRFDFCGIGLDAINGTFGASGLSLRELQALMVGNVVEVDGIVHRYTVGRRRCRTCIEERVAILLKFPLKNQACPFVIRAGRASQEYSDWFYNSDRPRNSYK